MTHYDKLFPDNRKSGKTILRQAQLVMLRMFAIFDHICRKHNLQYWMCSGTLLGAIRHQGFISWDDDLDICMIREDYDKFIKIAQKELPKDLFLQTRETDPYYDYLALPCKIRDTKSIIISEGLEHKKYNMGLFIDIFPADRFHIESNLFKKEQRIKSYFHYLCKGLDTELDKTSITKQCISLGIPIFRFLAKKYLKKTAQFYIIANKNLDSNCYIGHGFDTPWRRYFKYQDIFPLKEYTFEGHTFLGPQNADAYLSELYGTNYMTPPPIKERIQKHATNLKPIFKS